MNAADAPQPHPPRRASAQAPSAVRAWTPLTRRLNRFAADGVYALLLISAFALAGWLLARHEHSWDWTLAQRNSLSAASLALLQRLGPGLEIRVYAAPGGRIAHAVEPLLQRYQRVRPEIEVRFVDPQRFPERARRAEVRLQGQLVLGYQGRRETLTRLDEAALTNAIARLLLDDPPWIAVLEGHGEAAADGRGSGGLGRFAELLRQRGYRLQPLDLARQQRVPDNTDLLLITTPAIDLFPGEAEAVLAYLAGGGSLLWLLDPGGEPGAAPRDEPAQRGLAPLAAHLGVSLLPGRIVDAAAGELALDAPTTAVIEDWPEHALGRGLDGPALLPGTAALQRTDAGAGWQLEAVLETGAPSWNETGPVEGEIRRDPAANEQGGPLAVALALQRPLALAAVAQAEAAGTAAASAADPGAPPAADSGAAGAVQRALIVGDSDFMTNAQLHKGANRALALQLVHWTAQRAEPVMVPAPAQAPARIRLTPLRAALTAAGVLIAAPALLVALGLGIGWLRARG